MCTRNEKCFTFSRSAASLQEISAFNVALQLWRNHWPRRYKSSQTKEKFSTLFGHELKKIISSIRHQALPVKYTTIIIEFVKLIKNEIDKWIFIEYPPLCYSWPAFSTLPSSFVMFSNLNEVVWHHDNLTIDYEKTAKNMLKNESEVFDNKQLFVLACAFFLVEDIPRLRKIVGCSGPMPAFWIDLYRYPHLFPDGFNFVNIVPLINAIRLKSVCKCEKNQRTAETWSVPLQKWLVLEMMDRINSGQSNCPLLDFQHCWDQLNSNCRSEVISHLIQNRLRYLFEFVFENLSQRQWIELVGKMGGFIMGNLIKLYRDYDLIMQIWTHVKDFFSKHQFVYMMNYNITGEILCCEDEECLHKNLWITAPDFLKKVTVDQFLRCEGLIKCKGFLREILKLANDQQKGKFLQKNFSLVIRHYSTTDFSAILGTYFGQKLVSRVKKFLRIDEEFVTEMCLSRFLRSLDEFDSFLAWVEADESLIIKLKRSVLQECISPSTSKPILGLPHCLKEYKKLDKFICEAFPEPDLAIGFKYEFISLVSLGKHFSPGIFHSPSALSSMPNFAESSLCEEFLIEIKRNFILEFGVFVDGGYFSSIDPRHLEIVDEFLTWCLDDLPDSLFHFKKSLDLETVFYKMLCGVSWIPKPVDKNYILSFFRIPRQGSTKSVLLALSYLIVVMRQENVNDVSNGRNFLRVGSRKSFPVLNVCNIS